MQRLIWLTLKDNRAKTTANITVRGSKQTSNKANNNKSTFFILLLLSLAKVKKCSRILRYFYLTPKSKILQDLQSKNIPFRPVSGST